MNDSVAIGAHQRQICRRRFLSVAVIVNRLRVMTLNETQPPLAVPLCEIEATYLAAQGTKFLHCPFFLRINEPDASSDLRLGRAKSSACLTIWGAFYSLLDFDVSSRFILS
jgi:hypothetical protein